MTLQAGESAPDLVVWPESALPDPVSHWLDRPETFAAPVPELLARRLRASMLVGAEYYRIRSLEDYDYFNAALAIDPSGTLDPRWTAKVYLVPFTERTPFRKWLGPLLEGRDGEIRWMAGAFSAPTEPRVLEFPQARVGVLVCYEEFFWTLSRRFRNEGAEIQAVITNDAWFGRTYFQRYMVDALRLRAIENRTAFVRAANTGISGFVDRRGRYLQESALFEPAVMHADLPLAESGTVYGRLGDWLAWVAVAGLLLALAVAGAARRSAALAQPAGFGGGGVVRDERPPDEDSLR